MSNKSSDAPLATKCCLSNPVFDATKQVIFTIDLTLSRSLRWAFNALTTLIAQSLAASLASSRVLSSPALPVYCITPSLTGICPDTNTRFPVCLVGTYIACGEAATGSSIPSSLILFSIFILKSSYILRSFVAIAK